MNHTLTEHRDDFDELYHIFETADFLQGGHHVRIEIYQAIHSVTKHFDVVAYQMKDDVWVRWRDFPWIDQPNPDDAMQQAINFLKEKMGPRAEAAAEAAAEDEPEAEEDEAEA